MRLVRYSFLLLVVALALASCDARRNLVGKWKVISVNVKKNQLIDTSTELVFDPEGYVMFNKGTAARGQWELTASNSTLSIFLYGKALQHDMEIKGEFDFSSDRLTIVDLKDATKVLLELKKIETEPTP